MTTSIVSRSQVVVALAAVSACALPAVASAQPEVRPAEPRARVVPFAPGQAIVRFKPGTVAEERGAARRAADVEFERALRLSRAQLVSVDGGVAAAVRRLERQPDVAYAQPDYRYEAIDAPAGWTTAAVNGGIEWGSSATAASGVRSATDSPDGNYGNAIDPEFWGESRLVRAAGVDLSGQRGCRMHFNARYAVEDGFDFLEAGAVTQAGFPSLVAHQFTGTTGNQFRREEVSVSPHDGETDVRPWFALLSDDSVAQDGAYVDEVRVICRDSTYLDAISPGSTYDRPDAGSYVRFSGTSMAAPHVAGVAALVRAAAPAATDTQVIAAIEEGGAPLTSLDGKTVTGCTADAAHAIAVASGAGMGPCSASAVPPSPDVPDDSFFAQLWGLQDAASPAPGVNALGAWETTRGAGQVIAVVDTGVDLTHPDLQDNLWTGPSEIHGFDFVDLDADPDDFEFHGTHVAGTAAAEAGNGLGVAGVAPDAEIMAVRALDGNGSGLTSTIADGIEFAAANGADVINLSLGVAGATDETLSYAIDVANASDVVIVAAAGNDGVDTTAEPTIPCSLPQPNIICVAATTETGALAAFSNFGTTHVDVGAPGASILSAKADYGAPLMTDGFEPPSTVLEPTGPTVPGQHTNGGSQPTSPAPPARRVPSRPSMASKTIRVTRRGAFRYSFRAPAGVTGNVAFKAAGRTVATRTFRRGGKVTVRVKLSKKRLRTLSRRGRLVLRATAVVRDPAGLTSTATARLTLRPPKR